jgi:ribose 5-phosphate isomerase A
MSLSKKNAAMGALKYIEDGMVVGLGSGTTTEYFIKLLGEKMKEDRLSVVGVPTSFDSEMQARKAGIPLIGLEREVDVAVDGADLVKDGYVLKGGGGALTREKVVDYSAEKFIVIVDSGKVGDGKEYPVVVEVVPFAYPFAMREVAELGLEPKLRVGGKKLGPVVTDNGNFILDCGGKVRGNASEFEGKLNSIPGVVENGIFSKYSKIIVGDEGGSREL